PHAGRARPHPGQIEDGEPFERARGSGERHSGTFGIVFCVRRVFPLRRERREARHSPIYRLLSTGARPAAWPHFLRTSGKSCDLSRRGDTAMVPRIRGASGSRPRTPVMTFPSPTKLKGLRCWRVLLALLIAGAASLAAAQERPRRPPAPAPEHH